MRVEFRFLPATGNEVDPFETARSDVPLAHALEAVIDGEEVNAKSTAVLKNGTAIEPSERDETSLTDGDVVTLLGRVAGGATTVVERTFRGISPRIAIHYLTGLGGEQAGEDRVEGEAWHAEISSRTIGIGPTLTLTEVSVRFEGEEDVLDPLIDAFARKAARAGG